MLHDDTTLVIGAGNYFLANVDTAAPVDITAPGVAWDNIGHTSVEDILSFSSEGGEATNIATLQNATLRTKYSTRSEALALTLQQFDEETLALYFGSNMVDLGNGFFGIPETPTPVTKAFLAVFIDGENAFGVYAPKAEIFRGDDLAFSDTESLAGLPVSVKPLKSGSNTWTYAVTPLVPA